MEKDQENQKQITKQEEEGEKREKPEDIKIKKNLELIKNNICFYYV